MLNRLVQFPGAYWLRNVVIHPSVEALFAISFHGVRRHGHDWNVQSFLDRELTLRFETGGLPPLADGWLRTIFLESHGWDKDADRNIYEGQQMEPLPFHAMSGYPYSAPERYPDDPVRRRYREEYNTRMVGETDPGREATE